MLEKTRRPAAECLLIDDSETNIATAQHLGFKTIHFESAGQLGMELSRLGILNLEIHTGFSKFQHFRKEGLLLR
jgi:FMN phosphatase YigB (HAD superfamily)